MNGTVNHAKPNSHAAGSAQSTATSESTEVIQETTSNKRKAQVVTAAFTQEQDRYANIPDPFSRADEKEHPASEHFSNDSFFGNSVDQGEAMGQSKTLPPPPRIFSTQDSGSAPPQVPMPVPQGQAPDTANCPTKEEMGIRGLASISLDIKPADTVPDECPLFDEPWQPRHWAWVDFHWKASAICHKPLYFEDVPLERYGHSHGMFTQPFVSGAHFFATIPALPYKMGIHHPTDCMYPLGYYRPGSCAPKLLYPLPLSWRGALYQGAASTGMVFLLP
ncbi:MAG: hypothetical protein MPJ50_11230 [Pirellulales bacterium]|nr:hypothetical protein [Pirellulales bacterium]